MTTRRNPMIMVEPTDCWDEPGTIKLCIGSKQYVSVSFLSPEEAQEVIDVLTEALS